MNKNTNSHIGAWPNQAVAISNALANGCQYWDMYDLISMWHPTAVSISDSLGLALSSPFYQPQGCVDLVPDSIPQKNSEGARNRTRDLQIHIMIR